MTDRHTEYTALLMRHRNTLWRLCWKRVNGDRDRCKDLLQEVSIALWENFDKLRTGSSPRQERAWVCWQARSVFYQVERRRTLSTVPINNTLSDDNTDEDSTNRKEQLDDLLSSLNPDEQRMVRLYLEGYRGDEIGERIGVSRDTVYQRMRRVVKKMQRVALILIAMLLTSAIAVAVVPQWRHFVFGGGKVEETVADTVPEINETSPAPSPAADTVLTTKITPKPSRPHPEPMEKIPPLDLFGIMDYTDSLCPLPLDDIPTVSADGTRLTVTGAKGEIIRVYDCGGNLVSAQRAGSICVIDLYPTPSAFGGWRYEYILQIGTRPPLRIQL